MSALFPPTVLHNTSRSAAHNKGVNQLACSIANDQLVSSAEHCSLSRRVRESEVVEVESEVERAHFRCSEVRTVIVEQLLLQRGVRVG